ncbi:MAG TPA: protein-glutamine glutaminase family protein [Bacteriovoracaceae bacterium]|nr:protein-glutamine glutaminase family protein [Bacteriovoracaceae bacterium]
MTIKKWLILLVIILGVQSLARADVIVTTVFNVIESKKAERILVLSGIDGRIYRYPKSEKNLKFLKTFRGSVVKLTFINTGKEAFITNIAKVHPGEVNTSEMDLNHFQYNQLRQFAPNDLQSEEKVKSLFDSMLNDGDKKRSQCFKRAHMWSYDMWSKLGLTTQKIFMFYTTRYSVLEDFEWWFHVAPMVVTGGVEYVLDGTFMEKPITVLEWQRHFMKTDKVNCPIIDKYQDYEQGQLKRLCYLMKTPMYYFTPVDIENRDKKGVEKNHWVLDELQDARRAFKNYDETYDGLDSGKPTTTY